MQQKTTPRTDLSLSAFIIAVCAAVLWESRDIPPGTFEPLGSAPAPQAVATIVIALCLVVMFRAWSSLARGVAVERGDEPVPRWADAAMVAALTVAYALALHLRLGRFDVITTVYLIATIGVLVRFERRRMMAAVAIAALVGFGCQVVFTRIFVVDLPGAF